MPTLTPQQQLANVRACCLADLAKLRAAGVTLARAARAVEAARIHRNGRRRPRYYDAAWGAVAGLEHYRRLKAEILAGIAREA